ncbi:radical SAM protein [candidate division KSB1 bacterium]|nr:radical SAM protein [candidate division KSB1 bacterium]RQW07357.1 MAG: radical SAM protein [candidate division KSB1 bacterium]
MITFGPVPSRRLGQSLGINNIPPKSCTYSCVYCQLGRTKKLEAQRRPFYKPEDIKHSVLKKIELAEKRGEPIDYLTFVPDGEPTLDINIGTEIDLIRETGVKIAVITNSSLIWDERVRDDLKKADWVSVKIDSMQDDMWHKINRPHRSLELAKILDGIKRFATEFQGRLVTETMLVRDLNDSEEQILQIASFLKQISPDTSCLSIPTRPPAGKWVQPPNEETLIRAYHILKSAIKNVEYLIGYEGNAFAFTGDVKNDLLAITAVHPMREEAVYEFLQKAESDWSAVDLLIKNGLMVKKTFQAKTFYARKLFAHE